MKLYYFFTFFAFVLLLNAIELKAQSTDEEQQVQAVIEQLFEGMRASDSTLVSASFTSDAIMKTVAKNREGEVVIMTGDLQKFLNAIGTPKEEIWDEKISGYDIKIDGDLATVWTPYQFYLGDEFSHCGVNSFQLAKTDSTWKIFFIVDTRRTTNCGD